MSLLGRLGLSDPERVLDSYVFELSGGMAQRAAIGLALMNSPKVVFADEPTSALDVAVQAQVVEELVSANREFGVSLLVVSHNIAVLAHMAQYLYVMKDGEVVEQGLSEQVVARPQHPYTRQLIASQAKERSMKALEVNGVSKRFPGMEKLALNRVGFTLEQGECLGIVGGSGSGKSTLARVITLLERPDGGSVSLFGKEILGLPRRQRKDVYSSIQMVFQMPLESFDPSYTLGASIAEVARSFGATRAEAKEQALEKLQLVGLDESFYQRFPSRVSGGQCQRAALARALTANPSVLICDEVTSALDVSTQAHIVSLIGELKGEVSIVFITHDLALVSELADRLLVLDEGEVAECGATESVVANPQSACAKKLMNSVLSLGGLG